MFTYPRGFSVLVYTQVGVRSVAALPQVATSRLRIQDSRSLHGGCGGASLCVQTRRMDISGSQGRLGWRLELGFHKYGAGAAG